MGKRIRLLEQRTSQNLEHLGPQQLFKFQVFLSLSKQRWIALNLVVNSILDDRFEDALSPLVFDHKVLVARCWRHNEVHQHAKLVPQTLIVFFVALHHYLVKLWLQRRDCFRIASNMRDCNLSTDFNQVPQSFNCEGDHVGAEVFGLIYDAD